jgi:hypothetical protein
MQIDHAVERFVIGLQRHPLPDCAEVVAEVEGVRGGLDPGEHPGASVRDKFGDRIGGRRRHTAIVAAGA